MEEAKQQLGPLQKLWVDTLRLQVYIQGKGALHRVFVDGSEAFCCLGVACTMYKHRARLFVEPRTTPVRAVNYTYNGSAQYMPKELIELLAMRERGVATLMLMNDGCGTSFLEIAAKMEADPANFFTEPR